MLRVHSAALTLDEQASYRYGGKLFHGLAYFASDDGEVLDLNLLHAGKIVAASDDWLSLPPAGLRADRRRLDMAGDYGPFLWKGAPFTGVAYVFASDHSCAVEQSYRAGLPDDGEKRTWYPCGAPYQTVREDEATAWFRDGALIARRVGGKPLLSLILGRDGRLGGIQLADAGLLDLPKIATLPMAEELFLLGPAIDTAMLDILHKHIALGTAERLRLIETGIDTAAMELLAQYRQLRAVSLLRNAGLNAQDASRLRQLRPDLTVEFEPPRAQET